MSRSILLTAVVAAASFAAPQAGAADDATPSSAYFGELHLHTALSTDAFANGTRKHPVTAYRFAQGDPVTLTSGETWRLSRPLDFAAVTDHAESFGDLALCMDPGNAAYAEPLCEGLRGADPMVMGRIIGGWTVTGAKLAPEICGEDGARCREAAKRTWQVVQEAANQSNQPGTFTALVGYEFSPVIIEAGHTSKIHRNVIFRGSEVPDHAFSSYDGTIEDLHAWLDETCAPPCRALTIPHNSNASSSQIFWEGKNSDGSAWTSETLERRARLEPLVEIYQGKGSSECHPGIGLTDEECGFEQWVRNCAPGERLGCATPSDMVRDAVVRGMRVEQERGVNPHKLGFIGSTDSHLGTPGATEESNYQGQLGHPDSTPRKRLSDSLYPDPDAPPSDDGGWGFGGPTKFSPGGLAAVWAPENTREAIFDALARREAFATSGTRIRVRFFGGSYADDTHERDDMVESGYRGGVPMGGDLARPKKAPTFLAAALRDPEGAPLQRIQIIKGWVEGGEERIAVRDIACAGGVEPDSESGRCPDNGASVDLETCATDAKTGADQLAATWTDPDFDPALPSLYYLRVLENPVCRWSTWDANRIGVEPSPHVPPTIQERAWTSPIWYTP